MRIQTILNQVEKFKSFVYGGVPDTHYSGWRRESRGLTSGMALILLSITGTMITVVVLPLRVCGASSIHACLPSPRDRGR